MGDGLGVLKILRDARVYAYERASANWKIEII